MSLSDSPIWSGTVNGQPASKGNSRRLVHVGGKVRFIKSEAALAFVAAMMRLPLPDEVITFPVILEATLFYASERPDLDESLVMDGLEKAGIIKNDRQIREKHIYHGIDKANPRAVIRLYRKDVQWIGT